LNYRKARTPLTPQDNSRKNKVKKSKIPLDLRQKKKVDHKDYTIITLYKECENMKTPSDISCVVFFSRARE
jgi:hypothetical protein